MSDSDRTLLAIALAGAAAFFSFKAFRVVSQLAEYHYAEEAAGDEGPINIVVDKAAQSKIDEIALDHIRGLSMWAKDVTDQMGMELTGIRVTVQQQDAPEGSYLPKDSYFRLRVRLDVTGSTALLSEFQEASERMLSSMVERHPSPAARALTVEINRVLPGSSSANS